MHYLSTHDLFCIADNNSFFQTIPEIQILLLPLVNLASCLTLQQPMHKRFLSCLCIHTQNVHLHATVFTAFFTCQISYVHTTNNSYKFLRS